MLFYIKEKYDPPGQKTKNMQLLPSISASAFKGWQTGAKWEEEEIPSTIRQPTRDFEEDSLIFILFASLNLAVSNYVSGVARNFEALMHILCTCVIYWAFRVFATDRRQKELSPCLHCLIYRQKQFNIFVLRPVLLLPVNTFIFRTVSFHNFQMRDQTRSEKKWVYVLSCAPLSVKTEAKMEQLYANNKNILYKR